MRIVTKKQLDKIKTSAFENGAEAAREGIRIMLNIPKLNDNPLVDDLIDALQHAWYLGYEKANQEWSEQLRDSRLEELAEISELIDRT